MLTRKQLEELEDQVRGLWIPMIQGFKQAQEQTIKLLGGYKVSKKVLNDFKFYELFPIAKEGIESMAVGAEKAVFELMNELSQNGNNKLAP